MRAKIALLASCCCLERSARSFTAPLASSCRRARHAEGPPPPRRDVDFSPSLPRQRREFSRRRPTLLGAGGAPFERAPWATEEAPTAEEGGRRGPSTDHRGEDVNGANGDVMGDMVKLLRRDDGVDEAWELSEISAYGEEEGGLEEYFKFAAAGVGLAILAGIGASILGLLGDFSLAETVAGVETFFANPTSALEAVVQNVEAMGPSGLLYFGVVYTVAEILAIPAIPLTASAGYLFGLREGTAVVLMSASIAAAASFLIGRTFLRRYVESVLEEYPKFQKIDKAIGREGFKLMLLLRLSPIFPFALSNYLYGATSVGFWPYFFGTMLGFAPGTVAYVYTGEIGKALTIDSAAAEPWYVYAGGLAVLVGFIKVVADVATGIIENLDEDDEE